MDRRQLACAAQHFGLWACKASWLNQAVAAYRAGSLPKVVVDPSNIDPGTDAPAKLYEVDPDGIATINIDGQITKGMSSFGGTSSVLTRKAVRAATSDPDVSGLMVMVDSPGGTVDGTMEMADEIAAAATAKVVHTHVFGLMCSASLWAGVQADFVSATALSEIGSIGVLAVVYDTSGAAEADGVKVHVISTGDMKGAFVPGAPVTDEMIAEVHGRVDDINGFFLNAVKKGRAATLPTLDSVRALADGRDWLAKDAKTNGLIDEVMTTDQAYAYLRRAIRADAKAAADSSASRARRTRLGSNL